MQQLDDDLYNEWVTIVVLEGTNIDMRAYVAKSSGAMPLSEENMSRLTV